MKYQYISTKVEAVRTASLDGEGTVVIPKWLLEALAGSPALGYKDWIVRKPDGSFGGYSEFEFHQEFEAIKE